MKLFRIALAVALGSAGLSARGGELLAARFRMAPERPYVGQPFEIRLEVEVSPGTEAQDLRVDGLSLDPCATVGAYTPEERRSERRGDRTVDVLAFVASGRATKPMRQELRGTLYARLVERRTIGFFSSSYSSTVAVHLDPFLTEFRPLPATGVPPGFQGAIGSFRLTGTLEPEQAMPGDLVNLSLTLSGSGWLGDAQILLPQPGPAFRVYPPQELTRNAKGSLALRQVVVPLSTNATRIGAARFPYFDPVAGSYRETTAGPFVLALTTQPRANALPVVKHFDAQPLSAEATAGDRLAAAATVDRAGRWLPFAAAILAAVLLTAMLYPWRARLAIAAGVLVLAAGLTAGTRWVGQSDRLHRTVSALATARLCPSEHARSLFALSPGRVVTPVEFAGDWVLVDADGRRGWIPCRAMR